MSRTFVPRWASTHRSPVLRDISLTYQINTTLPIDRATPIVQRSGADCIKSKHRMFHRSLKLWDHMVSKLQIGLKHSVFSLEQSCQLFERLVSHGKLTSLLRISCRTHHRQTRQPAQPSYAFAPPFPFLRPSLIHI